MKIIATSDLHGGKTSFYDIEKFAKKANKYDLLIIAGDIACPPHNFQKTLSYFTVKTVVVPGNHDVWTSDPEPHASLIIYNVILPHICEKLNVHYLDKKPLIISDKLAIVGTMGWYDYSFKDKSVPATGLDYSNKSFCGSVFCDKYYVKWHYDDKQFVKYQLKLMKKHLELVKDIETVIFVSHFVPYKEALDCLDYYQKLKAKSDKRNAYAADIKRTQQMFWRFGNAFQGSDKIGKLLDQYNNVKYIICGHQHKGKHIIHNSKDIYVIDTDYGKIRYNTLTLK